MMIDLLQQALAVFYLVVPLYTHLFSELLRQLLGLTGRHRGKCDDGDAVGWMRMGLAFF